MSKRLGLIGPIVLAAAMLGVGAALWLVLRHPAETADARQSASARRSSAWLAAESLSDSLCSLLESGASNAAATGPNLARLIQAPMALDWIREEFEQTNTPVACYRLAMPAVDFEGAPCQMAHAVLLGSPVLAAADIRDPKAFVANLAGGANPLSRFLAGRLDQRGRAELTNAAAAAGEIQAVPVALLDSLNEILRSGSIYETQRFAQLQIAEGVRKLIAQETNYPCAGLLNKLLLIRAFPQELVTNLDVTPLLIEARISLLNTNYSRCLGFLEVASVLEPENGWHRLNLAGLVLLVEENMMKIAEAHSALRNLSNQPEFAKPALRLLAIDSLKRRDLPAAQQYGNALKTRSGEFQDQLLRLRVAQAATPDQAAANLAELRKGAAERGEDALWLARWMTQQGKAAEASRWIRNELSADRQKDPLVRLALWECCEATKDWSLANEWLQKERWRETDYLRWALLGRLAEYRQQRHSRSFYWNAATKRGGKSCGAQVALYGLARSWGWTDQTQETLKDICLRFQGQAWSRWAFQELERQYVSQRNTLELHKIYGALLKIEPQNLTYQKGYMVTALLTGLDLKEAGRQADDLKKQLPDDPEIIAAHAYYLHQANFATRIGIKNMEKLKPQDLAKPHVAVFYVVMLAYGNETARAAKVMESIPQSDLWPEERALLEEAGKLIKRRQR